MEPSATGIILSLIAPVAAGWIGTAAFSLRIMWWVQRLLGIGLVYGLIDGASGGFSGMNGQILAILCLVLMGAFGLGMLLGGLVNPRR